MVCEQLLSSLWRPQVRVLILVLMEYGLRGKMAVLEERLESVLILVLMEYGLRAGYASPEGNASYNVLILVLMEYGL